ncbi:exo-beta-1,4-galactosidase [Arachidicoccus terrestris]|uniref:exo-beta-1,4-galactosidase n=1 Tax=Arachidicoccus terrestris TaxID=2875539 RepID=UPI001CC49B9C|nr:sugar-binding domain-containing protein [Arachidicoccus terrestris]UAY53802.1 beta-glucuronidase [Arachidicoccus terrestris]
MNRILYCLLSFIFCSFTLISSEAQSVISIAGKWSFAIDPTDQGIIQKWFDNTLKDSVYLPGSMLENNKGDKVSLNTTWTASIYDSSWYFNPRMAKYRNQDIPMFPFWLTPKYHYTGAAWYQKEITIPDSWQNTQVKLFLERCHTETTVWLDNKRLGTRNSLVAPHEYDLSTIATPGRHILTIRIDNRLTTINVGKDSHSVTDQTQGNWNGIIGKMELRSNPMTAIEEVQVYPDIENHSATIHLSLSGNIDNAKSIVLSAKSYNSPKQDIVKSLTTKLIKIKSKDSILINYDLGKEVLLWSEFHPALYQLTVVLINKDGTRSEKQVSFGMRDFNVKGKQFEINGHKTFLRGTVENCDFPLTGYPPMDKKDWIRIFKICKSYGLNHMRFHSYCPPEAAFEAADLVGIYLQPEGPSWANHGTSLGDGKPVDQYIFDETDRMEKYYGNHPSYCMLAYGNEPRGGHQVEYLTKFIHYWEQKDSRRVYTGASVAMSWPIVPANQYMIKSGARGLSWNHQPESYSDYTDAIKKYNVPYIAHEMGQYCVFPDFREIGRYTGLYEARNFEMFRDILKDQGMGNEAGSFLMASGKLQALCYKNEIEKSFRTPLNGGFQLLALNDYSGQGTALVGVLNVFWKEKGYTDANIFSKFCNSTVPLLKTHSFVYTNDETFWGSAEIFHYTETDIKGADIYWNIADSLGRILQSGDFHKDIIAGTNTPVGDISFDLSTIHRAQRLVVTLGIKGTSYKNNWNIWVFPKDLPKLDISSIYYTTRLDSKAEQVLNAGGKVFLNVAGEVVKGKEIVQHFLPVFWNTSWFKMRPPHTTGFVLDPKNPAFRDFPTSYHSDLQWWQLVNRAQVMHLEDFPKNFRPLVQPIDTWFLSRRLASLFEAKVGKGKIIVSSLNIKGKEPSNNPAGQQLLYSLEKYMLSPAFNPKQQIGLQLIKDLITKPSKFTFDPFARDSPDELKPKADLTK